MRKRGFLCGFLSLPTGPISNDESELLQADDIFRRTGFHKVEYVKQTLVRAAFLEGRDDTGYFRGSVRTYDGFDGEVSDDYVLSTEPIPGISTYARTNGFVIFRPAFFSQFRSLICGDELLKHSEPLITVSNEVGQIWFQEMQGNGGWVSTCDSPRLEEHVASFVSIDGIEIVRDSLSLQAMMPKDNPLTLDI